MFSSLTASHFPGSFTDAATVLLELVKRNRLQIGTENFENEMYQTAYVHN